MKIKIKFLSDLKFHEVDLNDIRAICDHCGMVQRPYWTKLLAKKEAHYCEYCTYPTFIFLYKYQPIKINCKWCNPKKVKLTKHLPIKDFIILGA